MQIAVLKSDIVTFADVVNQHLAFDKSCEEERIIIDLINTAWMQRLRYISQTANTRLVYMFSEHSRFGHSVGVAYLARQVVKHLHKKQPHKVADFSTAIGIAALLHDLGHIAPGSHLAFRTWFPTATDCHEKLSVQIIDTDPEIRSILDDHSPDLAHLVKAIINEDPTIPRWAWQLLSGSGWNVDRGNWCYVDSVMAGVDYGKYSIHSIVESLTITDNDELALFENRLDAMVHFLVSRQALYRQVYLHRVLLAADTLLKALVHRIKKLNEAKFPHIFLDDTMLQVINSESAEQLSLQALFMMQEAWWHYHLLRWSQTDDKILADLASRILNRKLFKTVRINIEDYDLLISKTRQIMHLKGYDPEYYLHEISTFKVHDHDDQDCIKVLKEDGTIIDLQEADPIFQALAKTEKKHWLAVPEEIKMALGKVR